MTYPSTILADSPQLYWRLQEASGTSAADASGNSHTGTYTDSYTLNRTLSPLTTDAAARSVLLDGTDAYVQSSYAAFTGNKSFEGWGYRTSTAAAHVLFGGSGSSAVPMLRLASGSSGIFFWPDDTSSAVQFDNGWPLNQWVHYVLTFNNSTFDAILYINGAKNGTTKNPGQGYSGTAGNYKIGARRSGGGDTFAGNLAEPAVYPTLLTLSQVSAHFAAATAATTVDSFWTVAG